MKLEVFVQIVCLTAENLLAIGAVHVNNGSQGNNERLNSRLYEFHLFTYLPFQYGVSEVATIGRYRNVIIIRPHRPYYLRRCGLRVLLPTE